MRCDHVIEQLSAYLDGELSAAESAELRAHLDGCAQCRADFESLRRTAEGVKALPRSAAPPDLRQKIMARLDEAPARERSHWRHWRTWWGAAAAIVIGVAIMWLYNPPAAREQPKVARSPELPAGADGTAALDRDRAEGLERGRTTDGYVDRSKAQQHETNGAPTLMAKAPAAPRGAELRSLDDMKKAGDAPAAPVVVAKSGPSGTPVDGTLEQTVTTVASAAPAPSPSAQPAEAKQGLYYAAGAKDESARALKGGVAQPPAPAAPTVMAKARPATEKASQDKDTALGVTVAKAGSVRGDGAAAVGEDRLVREQRVVAKGAPSAPAPAAAPTRNAKVADAEALNAQPRVVDNVAQNAVQVRITEIVVAAKDPTAARTQVETLLARRGVARASYNDWAYNDNRYRREEAVQTARKAKETELGDKGTAFSVYLTPDQLAQFQNDLATAGLLKRSAGQIVTAPPPAAAEAQSRALSNTTADNSPPQQQARVQTQNQADVFLFDGRNDLAANTPQGRVPVIVLFERDAAAK